MINIDLISLALIHLHDYLLLCLLPLFLLSLSHQGLMSNHILLTNPKNLRKAKCLKFPQFSSLTISPTIQHHLGKVIMHPDYLIKFLSCHLFRFDLIDDFGI